MKRTLLSLFVIALLSFSMVFTTVVPNLNVATAKTLSELKREQSELESERSSINDDIEKAEQKIGELQAEQERILQEINRLELSITDTTNKIAEKNVEIALVEDEIAKLKEEIVALQERIEKRNEILKSRALSFQENGGMISYLDVLLGAQGFSDFIDRVTSVAAIMEADRDILTQHNLDKQSLETIQAEVEEQLANLQAMRADLEAMEASLKSQKGEKDRLVQSLKQEEIRVEEAKFTMEEEEAILAAQQKAVKAMISAEERRIAEEEARRRAEEEAKKQQESGGDSAGIPPISDGSFTNPTNGYLTSPFRPPHRPDHHGIDIGNRAATVPVVSAADGYVYMSYRSPSYGHVIFIRHNIDGQEYETVYAHLDSRGVEAGAFVVKGQFIGYMGNTGYSFGKHLHFEVHRGAWNANKTNAVNPLQFVNY